MLDVRMGVLILTSLLTTIAKGLPGDRVAHCRSGTKIDGEYLIRYHEPATATRAATGANVNVFDIDRMIFRAPTNTGAPGPAGIKTANTIPPTLALMQKRSFGDMQELAIRDDVLSIEENCRVNLAAAGAGAAAAALAAAGTTTPNDSLYSRQWGHLVIEAPVAWATSTGAKETVVAVIDTGVELVHPDLKPNLWTNIKERDGKPGIDDDNNGFVDDIHGYNFADRTGDPSPGSNISDDHGTHVAGIIGAAGNNGIGVAGVVWHTSLMAIRVFPSGADASVADILAAIYYAVDNGARVLNLSIGALALPQQASLQAFDYAINHDVLPVVASGNNGDDASKSWPANVRGVLTVGALDGSLEIAGFSNHGSTVKILAPGTAIYSTTPGANYDYMSGTSMAAPFVAGAAALARSLNPALTQAQLQNLIKTTGRTLPNLKYPVLNLSGLVASVLQTLPAPPVVRPPSPVPSPSLNPSGSETPAPAPSPSLAPTDGFPTNNDLDLSSGGPQTPEAKMGGCGRVAPSANSGSGSSPSTQTQGPGLLLVIAPLLLLGVLYRRTFQTESSRSWNCRA